MYHSQGNPAALAPEVDSPRGGLLNYSCLRVCLVWMLTAGAVYYSVARLGLLPEEIGEGYLADFAERFLLSPFYQLIGIA